MRRDSGSPVGTDTLLLARIADSAALLLWRYTKEGTPKPEPISDILTGRKKPAPKIKVFNSGKAFDRALARFVKGGNKNARE